jgi:hypothetical protein
MARRFVIGLLAFGAVWAFGSSTALSHDDDGRYAHGGDSGSPGPPELDRLSPYGEWEWEPEYGRVWRPYVHADWRPYWRGHWAWRGTWVWVSADPWGDGPFHYGEWIWSRRLGWIWVPGTVWAPARVTWIVNGPVIAWAPASVHITLGADHRFWVYADARRFEGPIVRPYRVPPAHARVRGGIPTRVPGRVFVAGNERGERELRTRDEPNRGGAVRSIHRAAAPRPDEGVRAPHREPGRGRTAESRSVRGFDLRERR